MCFFCDDYFILLYSLTLFKMMVFYFKEVMYEAVDTSEKNR